MKASLKADLQGFGHRMTKPRQAVLKILQQAKQPLAAPEILEKLCKKQIPLSILQRYTET